MTATDPLTLYCVPHAGGSARSFVRWRRELPPAVRALPLEIAGKGLRSREPRPATLREAAADLAHRVDPPGRYALLGHSMGGLLAYETALALHALGRPAPEFVLVAATRPPHLLGDSPYGPLLALGDDDALLDALADHGRIPPEVRRSPMRHQFVPVIRGDLGLVAGHRPARGHGGLAVLHARRAPRRGLRRRPLLPPRALRGGRGPAHGPGTAAAGTASSGTAASGPLTRGRRPAR